MFPPNIWDFDESMGERLNRYNKKKCNFCGREKDDRYHRQKQHPSDDMSHEFQEESIYKCITCGKESTHRNHLYWRFSGGPFMGAHSFIPSEEKLR